ncbi:yeats-domain-containing protein [Xylona heveae TC161]|uniref:Protein AF-9 homolog n=1 Tax=Xylona heveae (strain CBS 132557 / TC161) TaxID=1328760 RepID=A0A165G4S3_XYLHT|nr:yeats-domain-containing protein [Xylona heveae TC161]KZF21738.1 yeats-domain-containing protein [Xylona heveae TC161]
MPAPAGTKRVKGVSVYRPFVFGSIARPIDPNKKPPNLPPEHTHQWTVWVRGVDDEDISYWLKKVQFKLHETYANALRTVEGPPFEVSETGWGEFEIQIKLHFVPESNEKPQTLWHALKLHPYGPNAEQEKESRTPIISQNYEEVVFNEPVEQFYDILTGNGGASSAQQGGTKGKGGSKSSKQASAARGGAGQAGQGQGTRTAEIPDTPTAGNPYSRQTERQELDRMKEAIKTVEQMVDQEKKKLTEREKTLETLRQTEGIVVVKKK